MVQPLNLLCAVSSDTFNLIPAITANITLLSVLHTIMKLPSWNHQHEIIIMKSPSWNQHACTHVCWVDRHHWSMNLLQLFECWINQPSSLICFRRLCNQYNISFGIYCCRKPCRILIVNEFIAPICMLYQLTVTFNSTLAFMVNTLQISNK